MVEPGREIETLIWTDADRAELLHDVLDGMDGLRVLAVGGPRRGQLTDLAKKHEAPAVDDFRKMLIDTPGEYLLLGTDEGVNPEDLRVARQARMRILTIEPQADTLDELDAADRGREEAQGRMVITPWLRMSPAWLSAADPQDALGKIRSIRIASTCSAADGSLYGRLFDAFDLLLSLLGLPDTIDAALTGPLGEVPDELRGLTGHMTAHLRFGGHASATLHASDRAALWQRRIVVMGGEGQLFLDDDGYRLFGPDGTELDAAGPHHPPARPAELIRLQWKRWIDHPHLPKPIDPRAVIACCQTALLSCKTGNTESTDTLLRMHGG